MIKSRRMKWEGHIARLGEERGVYRVLVGKPEGKKPWGEPGVDVKVLLKRIFRKWDVRVWTGLIWLRLGTGTCECGNEPSGSIKCGEFLD
jgi:hypothetical protein